MPDPFLSPGQMLITSQMNRSCLHCPLNTPSTFTSFQFCMHDFHDGHALSIALFKCIDYSRASASHALVVKLSLMVAAQNIGTFL